MPGRLPECVSPPGRSWWRTLILIIKAKKLGGEIPELWNKTKIRKNTEQEQMKLI